MGLTILYLALSTLVAGTVAISFGDVINKFPPVCDGTLPISKLSKPITSFIGANRYSNELVTTTDCCLIPPINCTGIFYRASNEECNNLISTQWGAVGGNANYMLRLQFTNNEDYEQFDKTPDGKNKTSARLRSTTVLGGDELPSATLSHLAMTFGQGIAHDCVNSSAKAGPCCKGGEAIQDKDCAGVQIPKDDFHYAKYNKTCQDVPRIETNRDKLCPAIKPHQTNLVPTLIDASIVYGTTQETTNELRAFNGGLLKYEVINGYIYPITQEYGCDPRAKLCLKTGDTRANQNPGIAGLQVLYLRTHNGICEELSAKNPTWNDEKLFQEAKKLLIALIQKITYYDYLPKILGPELASKFTSTDPLTAAEWRVYNTFTHPGTIAEWNLCARTLHTMVRNKFLVCDKDGNLQDEKGYLLQDYFNRPDAVVEDFDGLMCGLTQQPAKKSDLNAVDSIWNNLFKGTKPTGDDLMSFDFRRNDEWLIDSYPKYLKNLFNDDVKSFEDLKEYMDDENIETLKKLYGEVENVDFYAGMLVERKEPGSIYGKSCNAITAEQFRRWGAPGDRFYYKIIGWFNQKQNDAIQNMTFSKILCRYGNNFPKVTKDAFLLPSESNPLVNCSELGYMSFDAWKE